MDQQSRLEKTELEPQSGLDSLIILLTNCSPAEADGLASSLVRERLAACVNVLGGVKSYYIWEGAFTEDAETTLLIKTTERRVDDLVARLRELHSYSTPEVVMLKPDAVDARYLSWAQESTGTQR